jgi:non-specific serine/threonine protein kinase
LAGLAELTRTRGDLRGAVERVTEAIGLWHDLGDEAGLAWSLARLAHYLVFLGEFDRAAPVSAEGLAVARRLASPRLLCPALIAAGDLAFCRGDYEAALAAFEENLARNREHVDPHLLAAMLAYHGIALRELGDYGRADASLTESVRVSLEAGRTHGTTVMLRDLGLTVLYRGDRERAGGLFVKALRMAQQLGARWSVCECLYELAGIAAGREQLPLAARLHGAAEALRDSLGTTLRAGQVARYGRSVEAMRAGLGAEGADQAIDDGRAMPLEAAVELAVTVAQPDLPDSAAATLSARAGPLSRREREIAILVADGRTNRQIAGQLDLSQRTVDAHLRNILGKLDLASRAQLAAWSVERGLLQSG